MDSQTKNQIQKLSLEHWFINYQLRAIAKEHFHLPGSIDVDVTNALAILDVEKPTTYMTALAIKALGLVLEGSPELNCRYVKSLFGPRMIYPSYIAVNVPIQVQFKEKKVLSALIIQDPHTKTIEAIREEIKVACAKGLDDKPVARFVATRSNNFLNRILLRILHFTAYRFPTLYLKRRGGGVSISSLLYEGKNASPMTTVAFGPTGFTVLLTSAWKEADRTYMRLGVGFDHMIGSGALAIVFVKKLASVLNGEDLINYARLVDIGRPTLVNRAKKSSPPDVAL